MDTLRPGIEAEMERHLQTGDVPMRLAALGVLSALSGSPDIDELLRGASRQVEAALWAAVCRTEGWTPADLIRAGMQCPQSQPDWLPRLGRIAVRCAADAGIDIKGYCAERVKDRQCELEMRAAAQAALRAFDEMETSLRGADPPHASTLLRAAQGSQERRPDTLLRAADGDDAAQDDAPAATTRPVARLARLWRRRE